MWVMASSLAKYLSISSYIRKPFLTYFSVLAAFWWYTGYWKQKEFKTVRMYTRMPSKNPAAGPYFGFPDSIKVQFIFFVLTKN
jgi:hypothetical protein